MEFDKDLECSTTLEKTNKASSGQTHKDQSETMAHKDLPEAHKHQYGSSSTS